MTDRPILFSGSMVRALLAGTKTQTRRVIDFPGVNEVVDFVRVGFDRDSGVPLYEMKDARGQHVSRPQGKHFVTPHWSPRSAVGDRLYVREGWKTHAAYDDISPATMGGDEAILYEADGAHQTWGYPAISKMGRFRQGMHMPRWASRLTLTVTEVRVQRLQDISEADAKAEGLESQLDGDADDSGRARIYEYFRAADYLPWIADPIEAYADLWDQLNDARGFGWDANPWVVAVSFSVERGNIDAARQR